jgi:hypothetical protein
MPIRTVIDENKKTFTIILIAHTARNAWVKALFPAMSELAVDR